MLKPFRLLQPETIEDASRALVEYGDESSIYAGGAELLLLMRHGIIDPQVLIDIKKIPELRDVRLEDGGVSIGANVTHFRLERDSMVAERLPMLVEAETHVGNVRVRNQGTLGGNLCFADPHADPATALLVHEAQVSLGSVTGRRTLSLDEFLVGTYETALEPDEILVSVYVPALPRVWGWSYQRIERFYRPTLNVAAAAVLNGKTIAEARLAVGCVGPRAVRLPELEAQLRGLELPEAVDAVRRSAPYLVERLDPVDDLLGPADYKIEITGVLLSRALGEALGGTHA